MGARKILTVRKRTSIQGPILQGRLSMCSVRADQTLTGRKAQTKTFASHPPRNGGRTTRAWTEREARGLCSPEDTQGAHGAPTTAGLLRGIATLGNFAWLNFTSLSLGFLNSDPKSRGHSQQTTCVTSPFSSHTWLSWRKGAVAFRDPLLSLARV